MSWLVRLYPRSWRKRYGRELDALVEEMPGRFGVALDLLIGAAIAYRDVIRANRVLSAAGAYLHGLCVAILLQAILFVSLVLAGQRSTTPVDLRLGPMDFASVQAPAYFGGPLRQEKLAMWQTVVIPIATEVLMLAVLVGALVVLLAAPRMLRSLR